MLAGSHCLDLKPSAKNESKWLKNQWAREIEIFERHINKAQK